MSHEHNGIPCSEDHQATYEHHHHHLAHPIGRMCCENGPCKLHTIDRFDADKHERERRIAEENEEDDDDDDSTPAARLQKYLKSVRKIKKVATI